MVRMALFMAPAILLSQLWGISGALREPSPSPAAPHCPLVAFLGIAVITALPLHGGCWVFPTLQDSPCPVSLGSLLGVGIRSFLL